MFNIADKINEDLQKELKMLPELPGIYIMKNIDNAVIYVGKSKNLRSRVRSYFQLSSADLPKNKAMLPLISSFEYIVTDNEVEALILENNLIKKHRPRFNVVLKNNKTYPYIKITTNETFPRILVVRQVDKDNAKYYGPYPSGYSVAEVLELIKQLWPLRMCERTVLNGIENNSKMGKACLNYHMGMCKAPCNGLIDKEKYAIMVNELIEFLNGRRSDVVKKLECEMQKASDEMKYEDAAKIRNRIFAIKKLDYEQKLDNGNGKNRDIIAFAKSEDEAMIQVFFIRDGKMIGREHHLMNGASSMSDSEIIHAFIMQFYNDNPDIPSELILQSEIECKDSVSVLLSRQKKSKVLITVPQKGEKAKLVAMAKQNAVISLERYGDVERREQVKTFGALKEISDALGLEGVILNRIEAFDISNIHGFESVASMIVYQNGKPLRKEYRKFKIKTVKSPDDFASMNEVISRRFERMLKEQEASVDSENKNSENKFSEMPDILFIDGGKGQVNVAESVLNRMSLKIPVCGMIKDERHRTRGLFYNGNEIALPRNSEGFKLVTRIQDEVHRFAVEYHRKLREKAMVKSELDDIKGVGEKRRKALIKHFGSIEEIKKADFEELCAVPFISKPVAMSIFNHFNPF